MMGTKVREFAPHILARSAPITLRDFLWGHSSYYSRNVFLVLPGSLARLTVAVLLTRTRRFVRMNPRVFIQPMIALASASLGLVAALAWNEAIKATLALLGLGESLAGLYTYAIVATIVAVVVLMSLARAAARVGVRQRSSERQKARAAYSRHGLGFRWVVLTYGKLLRRNDKRRGRCGVINVEASSRVPFG